MSHSKKICPSCARFVESLGGIPEGEEHKKRLEAGLRLSYMLPRPGHAYRDGSIAVSPAFHAEVVRVCAAWLVHLKEATGGKYLAVQQHTETLPEWARGPLQVANLGSRQVPPIDAAVDLAAAILGMTKSSIYTYRALGQLMGFGE